MLIKLEGNIVIVFPSLWSLIMQFIRVSPTEIIPLTSVQNVQLLPPTTVQELGASLESEHITSLIKRYLSSSKCLSYIDEETGKAMLACEYLSYNKYSTIAMEESSYPGLFKICTSSDEHIVSYEQAKEFKLDFILDSFSLQLEQTK